MEQTMEKIYDIQSLDKLENQILENRNQININSKNIKNQGHHNADDPDNHDENLRSASKTGLKSIDELYDNSI